MDENYNDAYQPEYTQPQQQYAPQPEYTQPQQQYAPQPEYAQPQQQYAPQPDYAQQPYGQQQYAQPQQPYGQQPYGAPPADSKSKLAAGLLAIFLGTLGIHKFYLGYTKEGVIMLVVSIVGGLLFGLGTAVMAVIALIEGIMYLTKSDQDFYNQYVVNQKGWF